MPTAGQPGIWPPAWNARLRSCGRGQRAAGPRFAHATAGAARARPLQPPRSVALADARGRSPGGQASGIRPRTVRFSNQSLGWRSLPVDVGVLQTTSMRAERGRPSNGRSSTLLSPIRTVNPAPDREARGAGGGTGSRAQCSRWLRTSARPIAAARVGARRSVMTLCSAGRRRSAAESDGSRADASSASEPHLPDGGSVARMTDLPGKPEVRVRAPSAARA